MGKGAMCLQGLFWNGKGRFIDDCERREKRKKGEGKKETGEDKILSNRGDGNPTCEKIP